MQTNARGYFLSIQKSPKAFRTISEAAEILELPPHVLRFWESKFTQIKPLKRAGGRRFYRPTDINLLKKIKYLLHEQGLTINGAKKMLIRRKLPKKTELESFDANSSQTNKVTPLVLALTLTKKLRKIDRFALQGKEISKSPNQEKLNIILKNLNTLRDNISERIEKA
jgi:DNA-binding transcriptional MerR regulator